MDGGIYDYSKKALPFRAGALANPTVESRRFKSGRYARVHATIT